VRELVELNDNLCPVCKSYNIDCVMDSVGDDGFRHESCGCYKCQSSWYNHYKLCDQEIVVLRGERML
jgi:formate dehydrogenase maturation protein FdhE